MREQVPQYEGDSICTSEQEGLMWFNHKMALTDCLHARGGHILFPVLTKLETICHVSNCIFWPCFFFPGLTEDYTGLYEWVRQIIVDRTLLPPCQTQFIFCVRLFYCFTGICSFQTRVHLFSEKQHIYVIKSHH